MTLSGISSIEQIRAEIGHFCISRRANTETAYSVFLDSYFEKLYSAGLSKDLSLFSQKELLDTFSLCIKDRRSKNGSEKLEESSARVYAYALVSFLKSLDINLDISPLGISEWKRSGSWYISEKEYEALIKSAEACINDPLISAEIQASAALAYHAGLSQGEILSLTHAAFFRSHEAITLHVPATTGQGRSILLPDHIREVILKVYDSQKTGPFILLGKDQVFPGDNSRKRQFCRLIERTSGYASDHFGIQKGITIRKLRTSRIYTDIITRRDRHEIMDFYGISMDYICHAVKAMGDEYDRNEADL